jgi:hypothetical protein
MEGIGAIGEAFSPLQREHPALQNMEFLTFIFL